MEATTTKSFVLHHTSARQHPSIGNSDSLELSFSAKRLTSPIAGRSEKSIKGEFAYYYVKVSSD